MKGDVHADHVLGGVELELHVTVPAAQALAARPPRLGHGAAVTRQFRQAARVTAAVVVRGASVVGVSADGYGGLDRGVFLRAGVYLAYAVDAEFVVEPTVVLGHARPTWAWTDRDRERERWSV